MKVGHSMQEKSIGIMLYNYNNIIPINSQVN